LPTTKIHWGQIVVVFSIVLLSLWAATQWTAWRLGFQSALGSPWFEAPGSFPVYSPLIFFWWWYAFDAYAPDIFLEGGAIAASGGFLSIIAAIAISVWRAREEREAETYGSARWATAKEIKSAELIGGRGVVLGKFGRDYLRHDGPEHILCFAPTRSGKGVGLVVPSLLAWPGSAIVHDIKGENWTLTSGYRSGFGNILLFDPTNPGSNAYNPLFEIRRGPFEIRDVQNIADVLVDPEGSLDRRNHWEKTSHSLLVGAILHVLYAEENKSLAGVANFLSDPTRDIKTTLDRMMQTPHLGPNRPHPVVASAARELKNKSDNECSGVLSTAMSFLGLYRDPIVAEVTARCDWRISDLTSSDRPTTLYIVIPPSDISRTKPLIRLMLNQIGRRLTEDLEEKNKRHRLLLMLDEFPALGRLDFFESALAFMAGYGIKAFLIAQSLNQIEKAYGANNSILDNCHVRVSFATNDERTAKRVSDALGMATEIRAMKNYAGHRLSPWLGHLMVSRSETARPLLTPGEIMQLPPDDEIVMAAGARPIRAKKARYYQDPRFMARILKSNPPVKQPFPGRTQDAWSTLRAEPAPVLGSTGTADAKGIASSDEGGRELRQELDEGVRLDAAHRLPDKQNEFAAFDPDDRAPARKTRAIDNRMIGIARQADLDRDNPSNL